MRKEIKTVLMNNAGKIKWSKSPLMNCPKVCMRWIPLVNPKEGVGSTFGIGEDGNWVFVSERGIVKSDAKGAESGWLLLLDYSLQEIREKLIVAEVCMSLVDYLPYEMLLAEGLTYGNERGILKSIAWIESDHTLLTDKISMLLKTIFEDRKYNQEARHRSRKLIKHQ